MKGNRGYIKGYRRYTLCFDTIEVTCSWNDSSVSRNHLWNGDSVTFLVSISSIRKEIDCSSV